MVIYAIGSDGAGISAADVARYGIKPPFTCPGCGRDLYFVGGTKRRPHFSHRNGETCIEYSSRAVNAQLRNFRGDMMKLFPPENRSVPLSTGDGEHVTADVFCNGLAVFFVSSEDEEDRELFRAKIEKLAAAAFQVCIIADAAADVFSGRLAPMGPESDTKLKWDSSPACIRWIDPKSVKSSVAVYLLMDDGIASGRGFPVINRVVWAAPPGEKAWTRIVIDKENLRVDESITPDDIFLTAFERAWKYIEKRKVNKFTELYAGEKGKGGKSVYSCPLTGNWLDVRTCIKCPHALAAVYYSTRENPRCNRVMCAYPEIVNPAGKKCKTFGHY